MIQMDDRLVFLGGVIIGYLLGAVTCKFLYESVYKKYTDAIAQEYRILLKKYKETETLNNQPKIEE